MIVEPIRYIDSFIDAGADSITIHYESCKNCRQVLEYIRDHSVKAGLAISPDTPYDVVLPLLDVVDMVLVMTVNPGFGGQSLIYGALDKVKALRKYIDENNLNIDIQVDGGINEKNVGLASSSGANVIVAGSAIFKAPKPRIAIGALREAINENPYMG
jgi:ribulose-phosphate 3-epimerase